MAKHYDWRSRINVRPNQPEAATLKYLKGAGNDVLPEAYRIVLALQVFYGTEAAAATGSETAREIALESIGLLLEQCLVVAEQGGIDLNALAYEPSVLSDLMREAEARRDPLRRSRKRQVRVIETEPNTAREGKHSTSNGQGDREVDAPSHLPPVQKQDPPPEIETPPIGSKAAGDKRKRNRLF